MTAATDTDVVLGFFAAWNLWDLAGVQAVFDPAGVFTPLFGALVSATRYRGHDGIAEMLRELQAEWAEYRYEPEQMLEDGDRVVAIVRIAARRPTGPVLEARAAYVCSVRDGRIVAMTGHDADETLERLG